jgi:hypothetical protein
MPFLNLDPAYFDHPKTARLGCLLGRGAAEIPIRLWAYCARYHRKDGNLTGYSPEILEAAIGWHGKAGRAVEALLTCGAHIGKMGFLEKTADGFKVHDWEEHQGHLEVYHQRAKTAAYVRHHARDGPSATGDGKQCLKQPSSIAPAGQGTAVQSTGVARARAALPGTGGGNGKPASLPSSGNPIPDWQIDEAERDILEAAEERRKAGLPS